MSTEEYKGKRVVTEQDLFQLTEKQMNDIANEPPKKNTGRELTYEERLKLSLGMKKHWFEKKNAK